MSQILKAKNRILNRSKILGNENLQQQQIQQSQKNYIEQSPYQTLVNQKNTYNTATKQYDTSRITQNKNTSQIKNLQAVSPSPNVVYNKKFNISSISMKFMKNQEQQQYQVDEFLNKQQINKNKRHTQPYQNIRIDTKRLKSDQKDHVDLKEKGFSQYNIKTHEVTEQYGDQTVRRPNHITRKYQNKRQFSPQFSHTERINPIRHFQPYNLVGTNLSQSNSQSNLRKQSKQKNNRRISMQSRIQQGKYPQTQYQQSQGKSDIKSFLQRKQSGKNLNESPINKIKKRVHSEQINLLIVKVDNVRSQSPYKPKQCLKQYVEQQIKSITQRPEQTRHYSSKQIPKSFIDKDFPPQHTIFFPKKSLYPTQPTLTFQKLIKCYQNMDIQTTLINSAQPTLINPGKYTNPYLYSGIRILAQDPKKVLSLFENQKINPQGIYYVRICRDGTWRYIMVDDYVPIKTEEKGNKKIISQFLGINNADENGIAQIWPALIQKALAKVYSTYHDLFLSRRDGICPLFRALTGYPVSKYDLIKDVRSYLVLIDSALKKGHIILMEQILPQFQYLAQIKGICPDQSYQVLEIQKNWFILRNLSDIDLVTKLTFDEVMMFSSLLIFRKQQNYAYISQKLRHKRGFYSTIKVTVPSNTLCYWDVWQNNPAYYKNHLQNRISYEVSPFKILIQPISIDPSVGQFDSLPQSQTIVESGRQVSMKKGEYLLSIHLCQKMKQMDYTISYYGQKDVQIQRVKNSHQKWNQRCCQN